MWQISLRILSPIVDVSSRCPASSRLGLVQCAQQQLEPFRVAGAGICRQGALGG